MLFRSDIVTLGPAPCIVSKRRGFYMWNLYYKAADPVAAGDFLRERIETFGKSGVLITVDVDPR